MKDLGNLLNNFLRSPSLKFNNNSELEYTACKVLSNQNGKLDNVGSVEDKIFFDSTVNFDEFQEGVLVFE